MRFAGKVFKSGRYWAVEVPILSVYSQGRTKKDALDMIADAIETLVNKPDFKIHIFSGKDGYFEIGASDESVLTAFLLRTGRARSGLTLAEVARRLGSTSVNAYARYEQGKAVPTVPKLSELLSALSPARDFVLAESQA